MSELVPFGSAAAWVAVLDRTPAAVAEALGLMDGRMVSPREAVEAVGDTGILPPLPGVGGRWTLAIGTGLARTSPRRITALSALLDTQVQAFVSDPGGPADRWASAERGTLLPEIPTESALSAAARLSLDPTTLTGPAPGPAMLFVEDDAGPPPPAPVPTRSRRWLWSPHSLR